MSVPEFLNAAAPPPEELPASVDPQSIEGLFLVALQKPTPAERAAYLDEVCGGDEDRRRRITALLRAYEDAGSFLETPAGGDRFRGTVDAATPNFLTPTDKAGYIGTLGPYEVLDVIGRGGMGIVLRALDPKLNRIVAVKVLAPELAANPNARKRFLREAQAAAAISHPHVVTIHAVEEGQPTSIDQRPSALPYLVMECVVGQSLQEKLDKVGSLGVTEILRISHQVACGLAAAHKQGLIHRDIKPANILLENGVERVKITDFGLARLVDDVTITRTGEVSGTPQYMSPEQAKGERVDHRGDLFSLGCVMYAMGTGHSPFRGDSLAHVIKRVTQDDPRSISEFSPEFPAWLGEIICKLLEKSPENRFQSAAELAELLGEHLARRQRSLPEGSSRVARHLTASHAVPAAKVVQPGMVPLAAIELPGWTRWLAVALVVIGLGMLVGGIGIVVYRLLSASSVAPQEQTEAVWFAVTGLLPMLVAVVLLKARMSARWLAVLLFLGLGPVGVGIWLWLQRRTNARTEDPRAASPWLQHLRTAGTTLVALGGSTLAWPFVFLLSGYLTSSGDLRQFDGEVLRVLAAPALLAVLLGGALRLAAWILSPELPSPGNATTGSDAGTAQTPNQAPSFWQRLSSSPGKTLAWLAIGCLLLFVVLPAVLIVVALAIPAWQARHPPTVTVAISHVVDHPIREIRTEWGERFTPDHFPFLLRMPAGSDQSLQVKYVNESGERELKKIVPLAGQPAGSTLLLDLTADIANADAQYDATQSQTEPASFSSGPPGVSVPEQGAGYTTSGVAAPGETASPDDVVGTDDTQPIADDQ